jgi:hypothetical protein
MTILLEFPIKIIQFSERLAIQNDGNHNEFGTRGVINEAEQIDIF